MSSPRGCNREWMVYILRHGPTPRNELAEHPSASYDAALHLDVVFLTQIWFMYQMAIGPPDGGSRGRARGGEAHGV